MIVIKEPHEIAMMRANGQVLGTLAEKLRAMVVPGVTTFELDEVAEAFIREAGALPSFKGYRQTGTPPFPATICASLNDQVVHGIPNRRQLREGDILSIDLGLHRGGYHVDMAFTVGVGELPERVRLLLDVTERSLYQGVACAREGKRIGDIGHAVESTASPHRFGVVRQFVGHGIGRALHERPSVPNYGKPNTGDLLKAGMCLAIEPMITLGTWDTKVLKDGWTVVTKDGSLAAHFEHTVAITPEGPEVLTRAPPPRIPSDEPAAPARSGE